MQCILRLHAPLAARSRPHKRKAAHCAGAALKFGNMEIVAEGCMRTTGDGRTSLSDFGPRAPMPAARCTCARFSARQVTAGD